MTLGPNELNSHGIIVAQDDHDRVSCGITAWDQEVLASRADQQPKVGIAKQVGSIPASQRGFIHSPERVKEEALRAVDNNRRLIAEVPCCKPIAVTPAECVREIGDRPQQIDRNQNGDEPQPGPPKPSRLKTA